MGGSNGSGATRTLSCEKTVGSGDSSNCTYSAPGLSLPALSMQVPAEEEIREGWNKRKSTEN
jgi:hypothetical protein